MAVAGTLSSVEVDLFGDAAVTLDVRRTTGVGYPSLGGVAGDPMGSVVLTPPNTSFGFVRADFSAFGISVQPGDTLALVLSGPGVHNWKMSFDADATYAGGQAFLRSDTDWQRFPDVFNTFFAGDFHFRTFVISEPSFGILWGAAVLSLLRCLRRSPSGKQVNPHR